MTTTAKVAVQQAIDLLTKPNQTVEFPLSDNVVEAIETAMVGFESSGQVKDDMRDRPISTLLRFIQFLST